ARVTSAQDVLRDSEFDPRRSANCRKSQPLNRRDCFSLRPENLPRASKFRLVIGLTEGFYMGEAMKIPKIAAVAVLVLGSLAADNVAPSKAELEAMYDKAFRAFDTNNFPDALKDLDAIDA